jgi:16S rRNA (uracil1498-N3)-methyltransferase
VRRLAAGELVDVTDGAGLVVHCIVAAARPGELDLTVLKRHAEPPPACRLVVVQAILKGDRGELAVELMTEVGVDEVVPWAAQRSVVRWRPEREDKALTRWRSTAREAAKQSRRFRFPEVTGQASTPAVLSRVAAAGAAIVLDPAGPDRLADSVWPASGELILVVGPEGGISPAETTALTQAGAMLARLGPTVLRGSTAGAAAAAVLLSHSVRWP